MKQVTVKMAGFGNVISNTSEYDFQERNFYSDSIRMINDSASSDINWIPSLTDTPYEESNTSNPDQASVASILEKCTLQLLELHPPFQNFSDEKKHFTICDFCPLDSEELNILYSDLTCVNTVYHPVPLFCALFGLVFVLGLIGNVLVICGVQTGGRALSSVMHMFIVNLSVGDLLIVLICLPFTVTSNMVFHYWPFGGVLCVGVSYLQAVSVFVSSYSLVAVSIDRYMAIIYPLRPRITRLTAKVVIGVIWILAFATGMPVAYYSKLVVPDEGYHQHHNVSVCQEVWPDEHDELRRVYSLVLMTLHYFLPVTVMVFTYTRIAQRVWCSKESRDVRRFKASTQLSYSFSTTVGTLQRQSSSSSTRSCAPHSPTSPNIPGQSPLKLIRMTVTVVSVYSLCWLPFNVLMVLQEYRPEILNMTGLHYLWAGCYFLAMLHTVFNVLLLYWLNPAFRYSVLMLLCKLCPCCRASLDCRLQRLSSSRFHRKNTFTNSYGVANCTVTVRQCGGLSRRYHNSRGDRGDSVTRTASTRTVDETISLTTPRASNNPGVPSPNDLSTLHEISSDTVFDPAAGNVITTSFVTCSTLASNRHSDGVGDPLLPMLRDTVTTDDDCRSEVEANRRTLSYTDDVFLPDQHGDFAVEDVPHCTLHVSQNASQVDGEEDEEVLCDALPDVEASNRQRNSKQDNRSMSREGGLDRDQSQENQIGINNRQPEDQIRTRDIVLKLGNPEDAAAGLLERQSSSEWDEEELMLPDARHLKNVHKLKRLSATGKTSPILQDNTRTVTVTEEECVASSSLTVGEHLQRADSKRYTFVLQREVLSESYDGVEL